MGRTMPDAHRRGLASPLLILVALASGCGRESPRSQAGGPRNLLLITVDTLRADHLGTYGYARSTTPELDRLAAQSVVFEQAYASSCWTLPTLASLMTSQFASTHGCVSDATGLSPGFETLAERLGAAGFRTAAVVTHIFLDRRYGLHQGFDSYDDELVRSTFDESHRAITSPTITEKGLALLEACASAPDERWFLWLHYFDPHSHYQAHPQVADFGPEEIDLYDSEIAFTDRAVGRVLARLDELGLAERTVVALLADHGEEFEDHGGKGHRFTLYNEVLRVPMMVRVAGIPPRRVESPVRTVDLAPTLLELLAVGTAGDMAGESLLPSLHGAPVPARPALGELQGRKVRRNVLVLGRWKLVQDLREKKTELFDLALDPLEREDRSAEQGEVVSALTRELAILRRSALRRREDVFGPPVRVELGEADHATLQELGYGGAAEDEEEDDGE